jgi:hypothetical protein
MTYANGVGELTAKLLKLGEGERKGVAAPPGWRPLGGEQPWPGMTLLVDVLAGGYEPARGFVGAASSAPVEAIPPPAAAEGQSDRDRSIE